MRLKKSIYLIAILYIILPGCKDEPEIKNENVTESINDWIYTNLEYYYLWSDELPAYKKTDINPEDYFYSLLSNKDRFSWIQGDFKELLESLQGVNKEAGYEFMLYGSNESEDVIGQITYIKKESPAATTVIKRGDFFTKINNQTITVNNYRDLLAELGADHTLEISRFDFSTEQIASIGTINFTVSTVAENPILLDTTYTIENQKIGYLIYNLFSTGIDGNDKLYLDQMDQTFNDFKSKGLDHLILDLRYNGGGAEIATINLGSLIAYDVSSDDIFIKRAYSRNYEDALIDEYGEDVLNRYFKNKAANIGSLLAGKELIVLTSSRTASASELLINCLRPYMDVFIIGDVTVGKNVGSTTLYDRDNPDNNYGMQPIITKSYNVLEQSDYETGFTPNILLKDNTIDKRELGDVRELLLSEAVNHINGAPSNVETNYARLKKYSQLEEIISSRELKGSYGQQYIANDEVMK